jgi:hypothetical protein
MMDDEADERVNATYGENHPRLSAVNSDTTRKIRVNQSIPPKSGEPRRKTRALRYRASFKPESRCEKKMNLLSHEIVFSQHASFRYPNRATGMNVRRG